MKGLPMRKKYMKLNTSWAKGEARLSDTDLKHLWGLAARGVHTDVIKYLDGIATECSHVSAKLKTIYEKAEPK